MSEDRGFWDQSGPKKKVLGYFKKYKHFLDNTYCNINMTIDQTIDPSLRIIHSHSLTIVR